MLGLENGMSDITFISVILVHLIDSYQLLRVRVFGVGGGGIQKFLVGFVQILPLATYNISKWGVTH